jgi:hypothetical protein
MQAASQIKAIILLTEEEQNWWGAEAHLKWSEKPEQ